MYECFTSQPNRFFPKKEFQVSNFKTWNSCLNLFAYKWRSRCLFVLLLPETALECKDFRFAQTKLIHISKYFLLTRWQRKKYAASWFEILETCSTTSRELPDWLLWLRSFPQRSQAASLMLLMSLSSQYSLYPDLILFLSFPVSPFESCRE